MDSSPFAKLPPEIRSVIFELALTHSQPLEVYGKTTDINALPRSCRQIHHESSHLIYQLNTFALSSRDLIKDFANDIGPLNTSLIHRLIIEVDCFVGYFGQDVNNFRNSIHCIIRDTTNYIPGTSESVVWPAVFVDRKHYSATEFEKFMRFVELDVRDIIGSLRRAIGWLKKAMGDEERQGVYQDLFWAKRVYGKYLKIEEEAYDSGMKDSETVVVKGQDLGQPRASIGICVD